MSAKPLLPLILLLAAAPARAQAPYGVFPHSYEIFQRLLADPREIQLSASYYRQQGFNRADAVLGNSWGMSRWYAQEGAWALQWDLEAMAFSRFTLSGGINEFETVDFFANLPLEVRRGDCSGKFTFFHESSHLGDDYIRRTGDTGFRYSVEGLRAVISDDVDKRLRLYGGGAYLLHRVLETGRGTLEAGFELKSADLGISADYPCRLYLAQDIQSHQNAGWNLNSNTVLGARVNFKEGLRAMRFFIGYFTGHSPYGQFYARREHYAHVGVAFDL